MLLEHFLAFRQSAGSNDDEHLEHFWTLASTQEKDQSDKDQICLQDWEMLESLVKF